VPDFSSYLDHLRVESRRSRDVLADCDPCSRVPACPDWDAADLLWHLAQVQGSWALTVRLRPTARPDLQVEPPQRPASYGGLLEAFDEFSAGLVFELGRADPAAAAWTWSAEQTVGFTYRRQAHEALIHRLDAEQAAGVEPMPVDRELAADGVLEVLDVMYGGCPTWGQFDPLPQYVEVRLTDTRSSVWVQLGRFCGTDPEGQAHAEEDLRVVVDPGTPAAAVVSGTAGDVDRWLWKRADDGGIAVSGDRDVYDRVRAILGQPLN